MAPIAGEVPFFLVKPAIACPLSPTPLPPSATLYPLPPTVCGTEVVSKCGTERGLAVPGDQPHEQHPRAARRYAPLWSYAGATGSPVLSERMAL
eukprot:1516075-Rhodomonas_salina.1